MLISIFQAVSAAVLAATVGVQGAASGVPSFFGAEFLNQNDAPPLFCWVPGKERPIGPHFGPPMGWGAGQSAQSPRALFGRQVPVRVHCWGADAGQSGDPLTPYTNAEQLFQILSQQMHELLTPASYEFAGGGFEQEAAFERAGRIYLADFLVKIQVADVSPTTADVTSFPITPQVQPY